MTSVLRKSSTFQIVLSENCEQSSFGLQASCAIYRYIVVQLIFCRKTWILYLILTLCWRKIRVVGVGCIQYFYDTDYEANCAEDLLELPSDI